MLHKNGNVEVPYSSLASRPDGVLDSLPTVTRGSVHIIA
jgi:hypothetical protein